MYQDLYVISIIHTYIFDALWFVYRAVYQFMKYKPEDTQEIPLQMEW